jgi:CDP-diacylglycerol pyrophosphatase
MMSVKLRFAAVVALAGAAALVGLEVYSQTRDALRIIVQDQCVPHWMQDKDPSPCASVTMSQTPRQFDGYALLPDIRGGAHFLLIPVKTVTGIESPDLLKPEAINYFADAWQARDRLKAVLGYDAARDDIGLAVNSHQHRSQDQLHIHIECLSRETYAALQMEADELSDQQWTPVKLGRSQFKAIRVMGEELGSNNPFALLAGKMPEAQSDMGSYTLLVAGMQFKAGPGFALVTGREVPGAESLLDPDCAVGARPAAH